VAVLGFVYTFKGNQPTNGLHSKLIVDSAHSIGIKDGKYCSHQL